MHEFAYGATSVPVTSARSTNPYALGRIAAAPPGIRSGSRRSYASARSVPIQEAPSASLLPITRSPV